MPELSPHTAQTDRRSGRRRGRSAKATRNLATERGLRSRIRFLVVLPALTGVVLAAATWSMWYFVGSGVETWSVAAGAAVATLGALVVSARKAATVSLVVHEQRVTNATSARQWVERFEAVTADGQQSIAQLLEEMSRGERPQLPEAPPRAVGEGNPFADLEHSLRLAQHQALSAVAEAGARQQVDVFVNIAQRLHALVNRALARLDDLESEVEDPDLLGGLFGVDHLVTQFRRQVESLAVMGGAVPRRINKPVPLPTVLRQGVAEIEQYARVRVIQPPEGALPGYAAAEVIHLLAELVENAARFSAPETQVTLRAERVPAGLAIEIDDRGLPMAADKLERMNRLLTRPDQFDIREQLEDGRIGLFVVAQIARRHDIDVALRRNIYGGTQAVVVLPSSLLDAMPPTDRRQSPAPEQAAHTGRPQHTDRSEQPQHQSQDRDRSEQPQHAQQLPDPGEAWSQPAPTPQPVPHQTPQIPQPRDHRSPLPAEAAARTPEPAAWGASQASNGAHAAPAHAVGSPLPAHASHGSSGSHGETPVRRIGSSTARAAAAAATAGSAPESPLPKRVPTTYGTPSEPVDVTPPPGEFPPAPPAGTSPPTDASTAPGRRPTLPKRSETYRGPEFPRLADADRQVVAPNPDLMARFASGIRLASAEDGPTGPSDHTS